MARTSRRLPAELLTSCFPAFIQRMVSASPRAIKIHPSRGLVNRYGRSRASGTSSRILTRLLSATATFCHNRTRRIADLDVLMGFLIECALHHVRRRADDRGQVWTGRGSRPAITERVDLADEALAMPALAVAT